jgi:outer membrane protein W
MLNRFALSLLVFLVAAPLASAQQEEPDFLFGAPRGAVSLRGGYLLASAKGDIYEFFSEELTIEPSDFNGIVFGLDGALALHSRIDLLVGFEYSRAAVDSEYRDFEEDNGAPITQTTELRTLPLSGSLKFYLTPRGRDISRFAFVPRKARPYVGVGVGLIWYELEQIGDFIDFTDLEIFPSEFQSSGWGTQAHVFGGLDLQVGPRWYLSFEGRYLWASADLSGDFVGFDPIDLDGLRITAGASITF